MGVAEHGSLARCSLIRTRHRLLPDSQHQYPTVQATTGPTNWQTAALPHCWLGRCRVGAGWLGAGRREWGAATYASRASHAGGAPPGRQTREKPYRRCDNRGVVADQGERQDQVAKAAAW